MSMYDKTMLEIILDDFALKNCAIKFFKSSHLTARRAHTNPCQINFNPHFPVNIRYNSADIAYVWM